MERSEDLGQRLVDHAGNEFDEDVVSEVEHPPLATGNHAGDAVPDLSLLYPADVADLKDADAVLISVDVLLPEKFSCEDQGDGRN